MGFFRHHRSRSKASGNDEMKGQNHSFVGPQARDPVVLQSRGASSICLQDPKCRENDQENFDLSPTEYLVENGSDCSISPFVPRSSARPVIGCFRKHLLLHPRYQQIVYSTVLQAPSRYKGVTGPVIGSFPVPAQYNHPFEYRELRRSRYRKIS